MMCGTSRHICVVTDATRPAAATTANFGAQDVAQLRVTDERVAVRVARGARPLADLARHRGGRARNVSASS